MTQDELLNRLHRIYASISATAQFDMTKLPAKVFRGGGVVGLFQDFTGNLSKHDIANAAHNVIHNIASLQDHLRRWAATNGKDKTKVDTTFDKSLDLQIIKDLWNNDKHGYPPRDAGHSGQTPKLVNVRRQMKLTTRPAAGSYVEMTFGPRGVPKIVGDGTACAVITGDVVAKNGTVIGDLFEVEQRAVEAWQTLLKDFGVALQVAGDGT